MGNKPTQFQRLSSVVPAEDISDEIWLHILEFLDAPAVGRVIARVSQRFYALSNNNNLWKFKCESIYGSSKLHNDDNHVLNWKQKYIEETFLKCKGSMKWSEPRLWVKPPARSRHTMNAVQDSKLILIGGRAGENLFQYDIKTRKFTCYEILDGVAPGYLSNHSSVVYDDKIYVFGGITENNMKSNILYELDVEQNSWRIVNAQGRAPRPRSDHAACVLGCKMYIIGGSSQTVVPLNDVHCFNLETLQWEELQTFAIDEEHALTPRSGHSMAAVGDNIFLFGGGVWDREQSTWVKKYNDLHCLNTNSLEWTKLDTYGAIPTVSKFTSILSIDHHILIAGGASIYDDEVTGDTYILDTVTLRWKKAPAKLVQKVDGASICLCGNRAYMFGGYCRGEKDTFSVLDLNWKKKATRFSLLHHSRSVPTFPTRSYSAPSMRSSVAPLSLSSQQHRISASKSLVLGMN